MAFTAVLMSGPGLCPWPGIANVGRRPTVQGIREQLEVHLLDFHGDLYGRHVKIDFLHYLRPEQRFPRSERHSTPPARWGAWIETWNAGATAQNVIADLVALLCGAEVGYQPVATRRQLARRARRRAMWRLMRPMV